MTKIIIHVGFPRTGTTFLQEQIFGKLRNVCLIMEEGADGCMV